MTIKGYDVGFGYMGFINGSYRLFATEEEYLNYARNCFSSFELYERRINDQNSREQ